MKISFSWRHDADCCTPFSETHPPGHDDFSLLDCLLMDSGGLGYAETIPWLNEGIKRVVAVAIGEQESSDWSRETWGVEFRNNTARIYSLHDEECSQVLTLGAFSKALQEWTAFLQTKPNDRTISFLI